MADFIQFVNDETLIMSDPVFSKEAVEQYLEKKPSYKKEKISAFATGNKENSDVCIYCNERHKLECCGCLKPMTVGHNAKTCTQRLTCSSCKGNHPTPLHGYTPNKKSKTDGNQAVDREGNLKSNFAGTSNDLKCASMTGKTGSEVISMCIALMKVKYEDDKDTITTYAMLDNCSQGSFSHDNLVKELGVHGIKTTLNLKTLHGKKEKASW